MWDKNEEMVNWYMEQTKPDSTVSRNINAVRKDAIISSITKMLEVSSKATSSSTTNTHILYSNFSGLSRGYFRRRGGSMSKPNICESWCGGSYIGTVTIE